MNTVPLRPCMNLGMSPNLWDEGQCALTHQIMNNIRTPSEDLSMVSMRFTRG